MVRRIAALLAAARIARFVEVVRTEGWRPALRAARRHTGMAIAGYVPPAVVPAPAGAPPGPRETPLSRLWSDLARSGAFHVSSPAVARRRRSVALIGDLNLPQCRKYRVEQMDEVWALAGAAYRFSHYEDVPRALDVMQDATCLMLYRVPKCDLVSAYLYEARRLGLPVIYDIDDPLFSVPAYETYANGACLPPDLLRHFVAEAPRYLDVMMQADALTLSTAGLAGHAGLFLPRPVHVRRNFADRETLAAGLVARGRRRRRDDRFTCVFASGSMGHEADFDVLADDLAGFLTAAPGRRLEILGRFDEGRLTEAIRARTTIRPFCDYPGYLQRLASAHCALIPLADDVFNRCKSGVRAIDAAAAGVPVVTGSVGEAPLLVEPGRTGMIVDPGPGGWAAALERLAADPAGAEAMGVAARATLEDRWTARLDAPVADAALMKEIAG